jgi:hypothetical protein
VVNDQILLRRGDVRDPLLRAALGVPGQTAPAAASTTRYSATAVIAPR